MDQEQIIMESSPTSYHTAQMSEILLSETERTKTIFEPLHVDNPHDTSKQLKGKLVFYKRSCQVVTEYLVRRPYPTEA